MPSDGAAVDTASAPERFCACCGSAAHSCWVVGWPSIASEIATGPSLACRAAMSRYGDPLCLPVEISRPSRKQEDRTDDGYRPGRRVERAVQKHAITIALTARTPGVRYAARGSWSSGDEQVNGPPARGGRGPRARVPLRHATQRRREMSARRVGHPAGCRHLSAIGGAKWAPGHASRCSLGRKAPGSRVADPFGTQKSPVDIRPTRPGQEGYLSRRQKSCRHT
jgi:hypothetical protein